MMKKILKSSKIFLKNLKRRMGEKIRLVRENAKEQQARKNWMNKKELVAYRTKIKVYDVFTFFNELDLLEIRLNILDPVVDFFVIVEATETFSGKPKALYYEENKERFAKWHHKIIHHITRDTPKDWDDLRERIKKNSLSPLEKEIAELALTSDNIAPGAVHWFKEFYQKENIRTALALAGLQDNDFCFISDVDEIWNPKIKMDYSQNAIFKLRQIVHPYYFNNRSSELWAGTLGARYANIKNTCLNHLRAAKKTKYFFLTNGGWHFTNIGGAEQIKKKLESYGHQEFNTATIKERIEAQIESNKDFIGRDFRFWKDESDLPEYILEMHKQEKYQKFFK